MSKGNASKRTARDRETDRKSRSAPLATANGYRPADGWGVVNQAWRPGKTGDFNRMGIVTMPAQDLKSCCFSAQPVVVSERRSMLEQTHDVVAGETVRLFGRIYQEPSGGNPHCCLTPPPQHP